MRQIYFYDEGDGTDKRLLGGKGAGLCEMTRLKLPVPPGFVITTEVCRRYYAGGKKLPRSLVPEIRKNISRIEKLTGKGWNSRTNPLLVSVRSGAAISMPGMMDTILNLGLNDATVAGPWPTGAATRGLRGTRTGGLSSCSARWCSGPTTPSLTRCWTAQKRRRARKRTAS